MDLDRELFYYIKDQTQSEADLLNFLESIPEDEMPKLEVQLFNIPIKSINTIILNFLKKKNIVIII